MTECEFFIRQAHTCASDQGVLALTTYLLTLDYTIRSIEHPMALFCFISGSQALHVAYLFDKMELFYPTHP